MCEYCENYCENCDEIADRVDELQSLLHTAELDKSTWQARCEKAEADEREACVEAVKKEIDGVENGSTYDNAYMAGMGQAVNLIRKRGESC